ncbi:MAG: ABC transporter permease [Verrucomicrobia bacterium]|nr:ABC transporter permease [Verrucomicrobiota bacterium]
MKPLRSLLKSPAFTFVAVVTLALGIGANTAMFSVIHSVLLRPLPYPNYERVGIVFEAGENFPQMSVAWPNFLDYRSQTQTIEHFAVARRDSFNLSGLEGREPEMVQGALVSANFFQVTGLPPKLGRTFNADEDKVGGAPVVVIGERLWTRVFQRDPNILGRSLNFGNQPYTVIGVMPLEMFSPRQVEAWFPVTPRSDAPGWADRGNHPGLIGWVRLKPNVSWEQAQTEMKGISARLEQLFPQTNHKVSATLTPLLENQVGEYRQGLGILLAATGLVLLIACANLANLLAARGAARAKELAVRAALGGSRLQLARGILAECGLLAVAGSVLGLLLAYACRGAILAMAPGDSLRFAQISIDGTVFLFTLGLALTTTFLFGLWPAWRASRADLQLALKSGAQAGSDSPPARRLRHALVIAEIALTLLLLAAAALVLQSLSLVRQLPLGYDLSGTISARVTLPTPAYEDREKRRVFSEALMAKLQEIPGVERAALTSNPPLLTGWQSSFTVAGKPEPPQGQRPLAEMNVITPEYFQLLRTGLLRGRAFDANDKLGSQRVAIIDQSMADKYFPGEDPIGRQLMMNTGANEREAITIVGLVPRLKLYGFEEAEFPLPQLYLPILQVPFNDFIVLVRTNATPQTIEPALRKAVAALDPTLPIHNLRTMDARLADTWATPRLTTNLLTAFAGLALVLAAVGIYGVMAYAAERRTREFGVRLALGATPAEMRRLIFTTGGKLLLIGLALGLVGAFLAARVLRSVLFGVSAFDPFSYLLAAGLLALAAVLACWWPARRAAKVNPIVALRTE